MMVKSQLSLPCSRIYTNTSSGTAIWKPTSTIRAKKPMIHAAARRVLRRATSGGCSCESLKSAASAPACLPKITQSASAAARKKSGIPMTSGKSFAFHGQSSALSVPHAESAMMASASASEVRLCMASPRAPGLEGGKDDHADRNDEQHHHHRPAEPRCVVARHRDVEIVLGDLAEHQAQHQRRARPAGHHHEVADRAEHDGHDDVGVAG